MKTKLFTALSLSALLLVSCSSDDDTNGGTGTEAGSGAGSKIQFVSSINTRVTNNSQWEGTEEIGIYMLKNGTQTIESSSSNVKYSTTSTGASASFTSTTPIEYPSAGNAVDFLAYYPYSTPNASTDFTYAINISSQADQSAIDFMTAKADNSGSGYISGTVPLVFKHNLVKINLLVKAGTGITSLTGMTVKIKGMNTQANYDISTNVLTPIASIADITPFATATANTYEAIVLPTTLSTQTIEFTIGSETYTWTINDASNTNNLSTLDAAKKYNYEVTLNKNSVTGTSVSVTATIEDWLNGGTVTGSVTGTGSTPPAPAVNYAIGDLYPDATNPTGIVYKLNDAAGTSGYVVNLTEQAKDYYVGGASLQNLSDAANGRVNTAELFTAIGGTNGEKFDNYPVFQYVESLNSASVDYTDISAKGVWYVPAINEMKEVWDAKDVLNPIIAANGGTQIAAQLYYSSSTGGGINYLYSGTSYTGGPNGGAGSGFQTRPILEF